MPQTSNQLMGDKCRLFRNENCITRNKHSKTDSGKMITLKYTVEGVTEQQTVKSHGKNFS